MPATFLLSLDCEGKWGVADHLDPARARDLSTASLRGAYKRLLALLDDYRIPATFAFVGLFAEAPDALHRLRPLLESLAEDAPDYLRPALDDIDRTRGDGWHGDWAVEGVMDASADHEIAYHGSSHVPWDRLDRDALATEWALFDALESPVRSSRTMVFPRNRVAHRESLSEHGIIGFRDGRRRSRIGSLASEFDVRARSEQPCLDGNPIVIPPGYFLNWRKGARRLVPRAVTRTRMAALFKDAARNDGIVHFWLHPENLASAPSTFALLEDLLALAAAARDADSCSIMTQRAYCLSLGERREARRATPAGTGHVPA